MRFTVNTKPLSAALNLGVINANISNYHSKSTIIQVTATKDTLKINVEAELIRTELTLKGSGDEDGPVSIFVGSALFKQLISTLETSTVTLEYVEGGLTVHSGSSKFTVPKMFDAEELQLESPVSADGVTFTKVNKDGWNFIKDRQMFALAMSFVYPVYTRVWIGEAGDALACDFGSSLFTHSKKGGLSTSCLVSDTIVNLFTSLPDNAEIAQVGRDYIVVANSDSFKYVTQFTPLLETDPGLGDYQAPLFISMMQHLDNAVKVKASVLSKYLSQAELLCSASEATINLHIDEKSLILKDNNVNCKVDINCPGVTPVDLEFKADRIRKLMSNFGEADICIAGYVPESATEAAGIVVWDNDLTALLAGVD